MLPQDSLPIHETGLESASTFRKYLDKYTGSVTAKAVFPLVCCRDHSST